MTSERAGGTRIALVGIFLLALLARAGVGIMARGHGEMEGLADRYLHDAYALAAGYGLVRPVEDAPREVNLIRLADSLAAQGRRITPQTAPHITPSRWRPSTLHPGGYAAFLSGVYRLFGPPLIPKAKVVQGVLDAASCLLVYLIGKRFAGRAVGLVAATAMALALPVAYLATSRVGDAFGPMLYVLVFWLSVRALDTRRLGWFAAAGAACGLVCLFRPSFLSYPLFFLLAALVFLRRPVRAIVGAAVLAAAMVVVLLPWGIRNQRVIGRFTLGSNLGWLTMYQCIGQFPNPYGIVFDDDRSKALAQRAGFESVDDPGADRFFRERFLRIARDNPRLLVGQMARRTLLAVAPLYRWGYVNRFYEARHGFYDYGAREGIGPREAIVRHPVEILHAYWDRMISMVIALALFVGCVALLVAERRRWRTVVLLLMPFVALVITHIPFNMGSRLLAAGLFCQLIVAAYWIVRLSGRAVELWQPQPVEAQAPPRRARAGAGTMRARP